MCCVEYCCLLVEKKAVINISYVCRWATITRCQNKAVVFKQMFVNSFCFYPTGHGFKILTLNNFKFEYLYTE